MGLVSHSGNRDSGAFTGINVTPLTDVMLVLLITFLLSATSFESSQLSVPLPQVEETQDLEKHAEIVSVTQDGTVEWPDSSWGDLSTESGFRKLKDASGHSKLALGVHQECRYGVLFTLLQAASEAGWQEVVLLTEERS